MTREELRAVVDAAVERLEPLCGARCGIGLILGSGLGGYAGRLEHVRTLSYA